VPACVAHTQSVTLTEWTLRDATALDHQSLCARWGVASGDWGLSLELVTLVVGNARQVHRNDMPDDFV
jgi:hypothetical protein